MTSNRDRLHMTPPKLGMRLLGRLLPEEERSETMGDFEERLQTKVRERGAAAARIWYGIQILRLVPYLAKDHVLWSFIMIRNYLKIALRNIRNNKTYSLLNLTGLAVGISAFIMIGAYVIYELSYDRYHANADRIYAVVSGGQVVTPYPLADALIEEFPEVESVTRTGGPGRNLIRYQGKEFYEDRVCWADERVFDVFSFQLVSGDKNTALKDPYSLVISEKISGKYFGGENPVGKVLNVVINDNNHDFIVTGVMNVYSG